MVSLEEGPFLVGLPRILFRVLGFIPQETRGVYGWKETVSVRPEHEGVQCIFSVSTNKEWDPTLGNRVFVRPCFEFKKYVR